MKEKMVKALVFLVALTVLAGGGKVFAAESRFPDMSGHWAAECVEALAEKGIISGMGDGRFHPNEWVTTAQFVKMVIQGFIGSFPPTGGHWATGYLDEALAREVINSNDDFERDKPLIRRFASRIGYDALLNIKKEKDEPDIQAADRLADLYSCRSCVWGMGQLYVKGIMIGFPDGYFHGDELLTRAEAAVIVMRLIDPSTRIPQKLELPKAGENGLISADEALQVMEDFPRVLLIDVRSLDDHEAGFIMGSICIPLEGILADLSQVEIPEERDTVIIFYCQDGSQSQKAYRKLKEAGYENVFSIGGIKDWPYATSSRF